MAAVIGAVIVGSKQVGIAKRQADITDKQADILDRQVKLEAAKLRADLFQRRLETFEATADFVLHIAALPEHDEKADARISLFAEKMRESQYLFEDPAVYKRLREIFEIGNKSRTDRAIAQAYHEEQRPDPDRQARQERMLNVAAWTFATLEELSDLFRHDLSILPRSKPQ
ncbi:hypothetical protein [Novosphingobium beihaiensis]|uniref:Uncharacterized protein n=1 Tax=Novosphingobium beihaiensis TaxID=2930389 RepID=A0ABT0BQP3_9SPHN|nr:hypothetical protein [Novosphingobium beihaiensis]MCJ2187374.1 hypothetical protein [Novosphingobium beihaiensis]